MITLLKSAPPANANSKSNTAKETDYAVLKNV